MTTVMPPMRQGYMEMDYNFGVQHAYNLSTRLYHEQRDPEVPLSQEAIVTAKDLEKLLQASQRLQLCDELTPVQVWAMVCKLNAISEIDPKVVAVMFEELSKYSYCNRCVTIPLHFISKPC